MLKRLIGEDVQMGTSLAPDVPPVKVDPGQMEQVIINLVVNARDAMPDGGQLTIHTSTFEADPEYCRTHPDRRAGRYARLELSDTGRGMTPEVKARIFEPFFTTKDAGQGTGLGLATVFGIVKQFDGHIEVRSEPGQGARFTIDLPAVDAAEVAAAREEAEGKNHVGTETILLVEDDESVRQIAKLTLEAYGYTVLVANDGTEGLQMAEANRERLSLILTDVVMPGTSGREVINRLTPGRPLKVLYMSGYIDDAVVRHGLIDEKAPFLQKPFTPRALARKVREVLDAVV